MNKQGTFSALLLILSVFIATHSGWTQYFGRNKVQYEDFNFKVLSTEKFEVYFYPSEKELVFDSTILLERWLERLEEVFKVTLSDRQPVILYANHADFQQTNVISGLIPQGVGGVTEGMKRRMVIPLTGFYRENDHVLGHELVHAFHYDIMKRAKGDLRIANQLPTWFIEGMAEYLTLGHHAPLTCMWLRDAVLNEDVPTLEEVMRNPKYFPYRYGHAIWAFLTEKYGDEVVPGLFNAIIHNGYQKGMRTVLGIKTDSLSTLWKEKVVNHFTPQLQNRTRPDSLGKELIAGKHLTNLSPVVSPDGKYLVYISNRSLFTMDYYLANAETGEVIKKLVSSGTDAHFDAIRFMNSIGSWSPDSRKFAFVVFKKGDNEIAILDVESRNIERIIHVDEVTAITDLAWSPKRDMIIVAGTRGGQSDLYALSLQSEEMQQITDDKYAEIQPDWSADGNLLAFVTDRGEKTSVSNLTFESVNIAVYDFDTEQINTISIAEGIKHINPQFYGNNELIFVSNADGFSDIYRCSLQQDRFYRVTRIATGISGLTQLSPAISVARDNGDIICSVFNKTSYSIHRIDHKNTAGDPFSFDENLYAQNTTFPKINVDEEMIVDRYLNIIPGDVPREEQFVIDPYNPSLELIYAGRPAIGVAVNRFGAALGGGVNMIFGDILGNHMLAAAVQMNGGLKDIGGQVSYINRDNRFNWGAVVGHIPYRTGRVFSGLDTVTVDGDRVLARDLEMVRYRIFYDQLSLIAEYPLSRNRRFEVNTGYTRISYDIESERILTTLDGYYLGSRQSQLDAPDAINLWQSSLAYVGDYSYFGFTSPIRGSRYRFEVEPTFGSLRYLSVLADYRGYQFWRPFTLAFRMLHHGRYLRDAESDRLSPMTVSYETMVRGYDLGSFNLSKECKDISDPYNCPELNRLLGSRLGVINVELRYPLLGTEQFGLLNFRYLPTDLVAFFDGGVAWTKYEEPVLKFKESSNERIPVFSTGLALRANLFGYLVGQVYYAYPFQRPEKGAHFGFVIAPGW
jgi:Tol biopolymer transport system component